MKFGRGTENLLCSADSRSDFVRDFFESLFMVQLRRTSCALSRQLLPTHVDRIGRRSALTSCRYYHREATPVWYQLTGMPSVAVSNSGGKPRCDNPTLSLAYLDPQGTSREAVLTIGVGPEVEDDSDHTHARNAFRNLVALFPTLKKFVEFPKGGVVEDNRLHGSDCRAPMILITDAP